MTEKEFEECEQAERQKHDDKVKELEKENTELKHQLIHRNCVDCSNHSSKLKMKVLELEKENAELKAQIEKMKSDVMANIKWADKNCDNMWQKLVKMWNQWEKVEK